MTSVATPVCRREVHRTRFGYVPCDFETFKKIKKTNCIFMHHLSVLGKLKRYNRKEPQNRVVRTPKRNEEGQIIGYTKRKITCPPEPCLLFETNPFIPMIYERARRPMATPEMVPIIPMSIESIDKLLEESRWWYIRNFTSHFRKNGYQLEN